MTGQRKKWGKCGISCRPALAWCHMVCWHVNGTTVDPPLGKEAKLSFFMYQLSIGCGPPFRWGEVWHLRHIWVVAPVSWGLSQKKKVVQQWMEWCPCLIEGSGWRTNNIHYNPYNLFKEHSRKSMFEGNGMLCNGISSISS